MQAELNAHLQTVQVSAEAYFIYIKSIMYTYDFSDIIKVS